MRTKQSNVGTRPAFGAWWTALLARGLLLLGLGDFVIWHQPGARTVVRGRVPASKIGRIEEFFSRDLAAPGTVIVRGTFARRSRSALRLGIIGRLDAGRRQRVRNFLVEVFR